MICRTDQEDHQPIPEGQRLRSIMLNTLLCYPDHPFGFETIYRKMWDRKAREYTIIKVADPATLDHEVIYPKERELIDDIRGELAQGRKCQVFATYTGKHDVVGRLDTVLRGAGFRVAVLRLRLQQTSAKRGTSASCRWAWMSSFATAAGGDWSRSPLLPNHLLLRNGIFHLHVASGQPPLLANRPAARRAREILLLCEHDAEQLHPPHGPEGSRFNDDGGQVQRRRPCRIEEDTDMMSAMARELVEQGGVGETADDVGGSQPAAPGANLVLPSPHYL